MSSIWDRGTEPGSEAEEAEAGGAGGLGRRRRVRDAEGNSDFSKMNTFTGTQGFLAPEARLLSGYGLRVPGSGFRVPGSVFRAAGFDFRIRVVSYPNQSVCNPYPVRYSIRVRTA